MRKPSFSRYYYSHCVKKHTFVDCCTGHPNRQAVLFGGNPFSFMQAVRFFFPLYFAHNQVRRRKKITGNPEQDVKIELAGHVEHLYRFSGTASIVFLVLLNTHARARTNAFSSPLFVCLFVWFVCFFVRSFHATEPADFQFIPGIPPAHEPLFSADGRRPENGGHVVAVCC